MTETTLHAAATSLLAAMAPPVEDDNEVGPTLETPEKLRRFLDHQWRGKELAENYLDMTQGLPLEITSSSQSVKTVAVIMTLAIRQLAFARELLKLFPFAIERSAEIPSLMDAFSRLSDRMDRLAYAGLAIGEGAEPFVMSSIAGVKLDAPLFGWVEPDDDGYIARCREIPQVYGFGETKKDACAMLEREIESLRRDLAESDDYSEEFLSVKALLGMVFP